MSIVNSKAAGFLISIAAISFSSTGFAGEEEMTDVIEHGKELHDNHCTKCHGDEVYTRENRFVKSIDALSKQVKRCKDNTNAPWFDEDSEAVVQFLNKKYYRF
jgi:hypothetical protein